MSTKLQAPKGFEDILPADAPRWQALERIAREVSALYHFHEIRTPVLEQTALFHRGVGETSDIVHKETFTFLDRGNESMTLRPEGTAGVVRAATPGPSWPRKPLRGGNPVEARIGVGRCRPRCPHGVGKRLHSGPINRSAPQRTAGGRGAAQRRRPEAQDRNLPTCLSQHAILHVNF